VLHRARWGEKTGEIVVEIVQDGGGWLRHRLYLVPGVLLGGLEHYQELCGARIFNFLVLMCFPPPSFVSSQQRHQKIHPFSSRLN
jgi:hypothetical protein